MILNKNTLWLQVPAAKRYYFNKYALTSSQDKLEQTAINLASLQGYKHPRLDKINIVLLVADLGLAIESKSTSNKSITIEMLQKYTHTSTSTRRFTKKFGAKLDIITLGTETNLSSLNGVINSSLGTGTANLCRSPAMSLEQLNKAINIGRQLAQRIKLSGSQLFVASEINELNSISALAMTCALFSVSPEDLSSSKTSCNHLIQVKIVKEALEQHKTQLESPLEILRCLGSFEISALTGSYLFCVHVGLPILINSYAGAVAALITSRLCPTAEQWFLFSHTPTEAGHKLILEELKAQVLIEKEKSENDIDDLVATLDFLQLACNKHNKVSSFLEQPIKEDLSRRVIYS